VSVRRATEADRETLRELWEEFTTELEEPDYWRETWEEAWADVRRYIAEDVALIAEGDGRAVGFALARRKRPRVGYLSDLYVRPEARGRGTAKALIAEVVAAMKDAGAEVLTLNVHVVNADARAVYARLGFREESIDLAAPLDALARRLGSTEAVPSFGSIHVQSDDLNAVVRAVRQFVPRLPGGSRGSAVAPPRNGWIAVYDELCDREPALLRRLARELSDRMGAVVLLLGLEEGQVVRYVLHERGRVVDEYLSVPEFHGSLPPGDAIALQANPTVVARLTGADPSRVRVVARTASSPAELPAPEDLLAALAEALGLEGATHGFAGATGVPDAVAIPGARG
jgi:ribosomal protein S18 acetylase RimI-like enzyme